MNNTQERYQNNFRKGGNNRPQETQANNKREEKEPLRINVEPEEFESVSKGKLITVTKLATKVNEIFRPVLAGYEGCTVIPDNYGGLEVALFFKDTGNMHTDKLKCIESVINNNHSGTIASRINNMNLRNRNKRYQLTNECKEVLTPFVKPQQGGKINWNELVTEETSQDFSGYAQYVIYVRVKVDLMRIIRAIWGGRKGKTNYEYLVNIVKPLGFANSGLSTDWLLSIQQLDVKEIQQVASEVGLVPSTGSLPIIR